MNRRLALIVTAIVLVLVSGWYVLSWKPQVSALNKARTAQTTALATRTRLSTELAGLRAMAKQIPADAAALSQTVPALPTTATIDTLIDQIDAAAIATGVTWPNESQTIAAATSSAAGAASSAGASTVTMAISVSGSYQSVTNFLLALEQRPRLLVVTSLAYAPTPTTVTATIAATAYYDPTPLPVLTTLNPTTLSSAAGRAAER